MASYNIEFDNHGTMFYRGFQIEIDTVDLGVYVESMHACFSAWSSKTGFVAYQETTLQEVFKKVDAYLGVENE